MASGSTSTNPIWLQILIALLGGSAVAALITVLFPHILGIGNKPPKAVIQVVEPPKVDTEGRLSVFPGMILEFDAYGSEDPEEGNDLKITWVLKRGNEVLGEPSNNMEYKTEPLEAGAYSLVLTVEDSRGKEHTARYRIVVNDSGEVLEQTAENDDAEESANDIASSENNSIEEQENDPLAINYEVWWQPWDSRRGNPPANALIVSFETENSVQDDPIFLCRAEDEGLLKPGKVVSSGKCEIPHRYSTESGTVKSEGRLSKEFPNYEIFVPQAAHKWVSSTDGINEERLVSTDMDERDSTIICRLEFGQRNTEGNFRIAKHPGILDRSINHCVFPWGDVVGFLDVDGEYDTYEVLTVGSNFD